MCLRLASVGLAALFVLSGVGCATGSPGPTVPDESELGALAINDPIFVSYEPGRGYTCSTWAGAKLWLNNADFAEAIKRTLSNARGNVVADENAARYVLSFSGAGAEVRYEMLDRASNRVVWRTTKPWPEQVSGCALCCNDHARTHFAWLAEDLAAWDGTPQATDQGEKQ